MDDICRTWGVNKSQGGIIQSMYGDYLVQSLNIQEIQSMEVGFSDYETVTGTAKEWIISRRMAISNGETEHIPGAISGGNLWLLPNDTGKPSGRPGEWYKKGGALVDQTD